MSRAIRSPKDPQTGTPGTRSPEKVAKHLRGVEYPATKEELLARARSAAAPDEVIEELMRLEGSRFESEDAVLLAYEDQWGSR